MKYLSFIFFILIIAACSNDNTTEQIEIDFGYDYYPLEVGKYIIYDVDSIVYDPVVGGTLIDTNSYQIQEIIVDTLIDNSGRTVYKIHFQTRKDATESWELKMVYTAVKTTIALVKTEDNLPFTKLIFPLKDTAKWAGNRLFNDENRIVTVRGETLEIFRNWESIVSSIGTNQTVGNQNFSDIVTIQHANDENLIERRFVEEKYARSVGLIEKKIMVLDTQCGGNLSNCEGLSWEEKAEKGFILKMTINDYN
jgi:hypothetical protein